MFITMLWVATGRWTYVVGGLVAFVAGTFLAAHLPFARTLIDQRVSAWINPWAHYGSYGYQTVQGELALGRGGLTGSGLGLGSPYNIPVAYSDFIFAAIGEELGLLGTTAVVVGFLLVVGSGIRAAIRARSEFSQLAAVGFTAILGFQSFFIMAGVVRLLPLTGVSLPFIGYGGSSLLANYVLVALLMRISAEGATPSAVPVGPGHWPRACASGRTPTARAETAPTDGASTGKGAARRRTGTGGPSSGRRTETAAVLTGRALSQLLRASWPACWRRLVRPERVRAGYGEHDRRGHYRHRQPGPKGEGDRVRGPAVDKAGPRGARRRPSRR